MSVTILEATVVEWIRVVGIAIDVFGVLIIVAGIAWATGLFLGRRTASEPLETFKIRIGRALLLGLEVLVAADIVKTIALEATFMSLAVLAGLVLIRTFLSWTLVLEIEGRWPWQAHAALVEEPRGVPIAGDGSEGASEAANAANRAHRT
jgi:uncharacterized membrane protein